MLCVQSLRTIPAVEVSWTEPDNGFGVAELREAYVAQGHHGECDPATNQSYAVWEAWQLEQERRRGRHGSRRTDAPTLGSVDATAAQRRELALEPRALRPQGLLVVVVVVVVLG